MSELINTQDNRATIRWKLLTSASAAALILSAYGVSEAYAAGSDSDQPQLWIELGGQWQSLTDSQESLSPPFMASITQANLLTALNVQKPIAFAIGDNARITFQPDDSDWVFSASIQYGRSGATRHHHQQTANKTIPVYFKLHAPFSNYHIGPKYYYPSLHARFADGQANLSETHLVLDFQAGKDVGLGLFGGKGSSVLSAGVRIAQLRSKSGVTLRAEPDVQYPTAPLHSKYDWAAFQKYHVRFHDYAAMMDAQRSFRGIGPSLAWNGSVPIAGDSANGEMSLDWGLNGALLFGRQRAVGHHKTIVQSYYEKQWKLGFAQGNIHPGHFTNGAAGYHTSHGYHVSYTGAPTARHTNSANFNRVRTVAVPNLGGVVGLSYRIQNFKVSLGYRADFFFNAIDGGIDTRKEENRGFFGPYASISVGLGN